MAEAVPFVGAGIGFLIGGPGGAKAGWMVGAAIYSAFAPAPKIAAGDPSTAPNVGSDIRGQTVPVHFGTVRAPGYLVWQKNFTAQKQTRKVGSGKKKSKQEYYAYYWDFIYHMGMATEDYKIIGIWEGSERVQDQSLLSITFANGSEFTSAPKEDQQTSIADLIGVGLFSGLQRFRQAEATQAGKTLTWTEAYFYGAYETADLADGWAYFQSQETLPDIRWPHTIWLGFRQLFLGEQPRIPQLNFEIAPAIDTGLIGNYIDTASAQVSGNNAHLPTGATLNGRYHLYSSVLNATMVRVMDSVTGLVTDSLVEADVTAAFPDVPVENLDDGDFKGAYMIPETTDFVMFFAGNDTSPGHSGNDTYTLAAFFQINDNGTVSPVGYTKMPSQFDWWETIYCVCLTQQQDYLLAAAEGVGLPTGRVNIGRIPYPRTQGDSLDGGDLNEGGDNNTDVSGALGEGLMSPNQTYQPMFANHGFAGFITPMESGDYRFYFYVSAARIRWSDDNPSVDNAYVAANKGTYPNGWMAYVEFDAEDMTVGGATVANGDFDQAGPPFDDENEDTDGSSAGTWTSAFDAVGYSERFFVQPGVMGVQNCDRVVIFEKQMSTPENTDGGAYHTARGFALNISTGVFTYLGNLAQDLEDVCLEYSLTPAARFTTYPDSDVLITYAPFGGAVFRAGVRASGSVWYGYAANCGKLVLGVVDYTPPEIIRTIFTNDVLGQAQPDSAIGSGYDDAVQFCRDNNILISASFAQNAERAAVFESLVSVYGGWVAWTGTQLLFGRPQETLTTVATISNEHFKQQNPERPEPPFNARKQALQDTANRITIRYYDRTLSYRRNEVTLNDEVDQDINGTRSRVIDTGFVMSKDTAYRMAERMLWSNLYARTIYSDIVVGWSRARIQPGDLVRLVDTPSNTDVIVRIVRREIVGRGTFKLTAVEELDYLGKSKPLFEPPQPPLRAVVTATDRPLDFEMYELPQEFQKEGPAYYVGWAPGGPSAGAGLYTSVSTTGFRLMESVVPYPDSGRIASFLPNSEGIVESAEVVVNCRSWGLANQFPTWFAGALENYGTVDRVLGLSVLRVGSEMMAYEGATLVGSNRYRLDRLYRGWGGTPISVHSAGETFWLHDPDDGGGMFRIPYAEDAIGNTIFYKVVPVGFDGIEYDPTSVPYKQYSITGAHFAPRGFRNSALRVLVGSHAAPLPATRPQKYEVWDTTSLFEISPYYTRVVGSGPERNIALSWPETSRTTGMGAKGYGVGGYGDFQADLDPVTWLVNVVGSGGTVVRSTVVSSPTFSYDAITNSGDNNGWRPNVAFHITPRNIYGDAPFSAVASMNFTG